MRSSSLPPWSFRLLWLIAAVVVTLIGIVAGRTWMTYHLADAPRAAAPAAVHAPADAADATHAPLVPADFFATALPTLDGGSGSLAAFKGQLVVVNFWASWCGPCVREMPALTAMATKYASLGVKFVGIGVDNPDNMRTFLQHVPVHYPIYVAGASGIDRARALGDDAGGLPYTVIIDAAGRVRWAKLGEIDPDGLSQAVDTVRAGAH